MLRVNATTRAGNGGIGYVVGGNGDTAQIWLAAFNMDTMALIGTSIIQPAGGAASGQFTNLGRYAGVTNGNDLYSFQFQRTSGFGGSCIAGGLCATLLKYQGASQVGISTNTGVRVDQMDDAKLVNGSTIGLVNAGAGNRRLSLWTLGLSNIATGTALSSGGFGLISRAMNGYNYVSIGNSLASPNIYRIPVGATAPDASTTLSYGGGGRASNAIYTFGDADGFVLNESTYFGGSNGLRNFMTAPGMVDSGVAATYIAGDQSAAYQQTFYDAVNNKVYSTRGDGGGGLSSNLIRSTPLGAIEQRFACANCIVGASQGIQASDFAPNMLRIFLVNNTNPPVISKIKVCATGGP
jgi:hypothetical protein